MKVLRILGSSVVLTLAALLGILFLVPFAALLAFAVFRLPWVFGAVVFIGILGLVAVLYIAGGLLLHGRPKATCPQCGEELSFWQRYFWGCPRCPQCPAAAESDERWIRLLLEIVGSLHD
jgi:hypothetical protein